MFHVHALTLPISPGSEYAFCDLGLNACAILQILLIMSHPPLVSSLVDVLVNGDEVTSDGTPEDSPLPLRKVSCLFSSFTVHYPLDLSFNFVSSWKLQTFISEC